MLNHEQNTDGDKTLPNAISEKPNDESGNHSDDRTEVRNDIADTGKDANEYRKLQARQSSMRLRKEFPR